MYAKSEIKMRNYNQESVQTRLKQIKNQFNWLINEIQKGQPERSLIKTKYGALKIKLKSDFNIFKTNKGQAQATNDESAFYYPAVTEAYLELKVKIDAPPNEKMLQCLISGEDYISYYLCNRSPG